MTDTVPLLAVENLCRRRPDADGWLLDRVSMALPAGSRVALTGPSGSGKTLLLRALAMLDPVDSGRLLWRGEPIARAVVPAFRSQVIYLHQRPAILGGGVEEALRLPYRLSVHRGSRYDEARIVAWLECLGRTGDLLRQSTTDLSGGERQIVALLRAIQLDPVVLLLDEPTAALDPQAVESVERLVARWFEAVPNRRAFCWVSHDQRQASRMTDSSLHMAAGCLAGPGTEGMEDAC
ncbi:MAG: ATP-binding cassette domain-containing protein [Patescibacteria group bacterium]|nr:ATP-binding cassette domain-containing protein [Patescibacteria group bacterium]